MLTPAQLATLKADVAANTNTMPAGRPFAGTAINAIPDTSDGNAAIAEWYNLLTSPSWLVWSTGVLVQKLFDVINWKNFTPLDAVPVTDTGNQYMNRCLLCQGKQFNLQTMLLGRTTVDASNNTFRTGLKDALQDLPSGAAGASLDAGWTAVRNAMSRQSRNIEKLLVTSGTGTLADAGTMGHEGTISGDDVQTARRS